jgi:hypothetical protein
MVQPAKDSGRDDAAVALNWPAKWCVFAEAEMSSGRVIVVPIRIQDALKV